MTRLQLILVLHLLGLDFQQIELVTLLHKLICDENNLLLSRNQLVHIQLIHVELVQ